MRVLFTSAAGFGHLHPKLPLAAALVAGGHEVAFAIPQRFCARVELAGFRAIATGPDGRQLADMVRQKHPGSENVAAADRLRFAFTKIIGVAVPAVLEDLLPVLDDWSPDLVIHDPSDWAAPIAAEAAGITYVNQSWGPLFPRAELEMGAAVVDPMWRSRGLEPPPFGGMFRHAYLDLCPPSLQAPHVAGLDVPRRPLRPVPFDALGTECLPPWVQHLPDQPSVYVTLGTWFNLETDVFSTVLDGLAGEPLNLVVTVGHANDPAAFGPQPDNVHIDRYIPVSQLLPHCHIVIGHGGAGSTLAALANGLPLLLLPRGADQFANAERCVDAGVGLCLSPAELDAPAVRRHTRALLDDPRFRQAAQVLRHEIEAMPEPAGIVPGLERLVRATRRSRHDTG